MQAGPSAQIDSPLLTRGALLRFQDGVPWSPEPFQIRFTGPHGSTLEVVCVFDDYVIPNATICWVCAARQISER